MNNHVHKKNIYALLILLMSVSVCAMQERKQSPRRTSPVIAPLNLDKLAIQQTVISSPPSGQSQDVYEEYCSYTLERFNERLQSARSSVISTPIDPSMSPLDRFSQTKREIAELQASPNIAHSPDALLRYNQHSKRLDILTKVVEAEISKMQDSQRSLEKDAQDEIVVGWCCFKSK